MVFSSIIFLFFYLPIILLCYFLIGKKLRNSLLFLGSLIFYFWGEQFYVLLMLSSVCCNYVFGILLEKTVNTRQRKQLLYFAISCNIAPLIFFKYLNFFGEHANAVFQVIKAGPLFSLQEIHLPIGISFFTFQAISYVIDVYRKVSPAQRNIVNMGLYISFFPQLIAGPIVRYHDIARQINKRKTTVEDFAAGVERFIFGLSKKVLIANEMGAMADSIFSLPGDQLSLTAAWLGIICYTLQIYFDFSGYSDMAIGLGRMFGFRFLENFNYPYISKSIQEFWKRWHISLSNWFRDYLYIPLGGNRLGSRRTSLNLLIVFLLCGLWHGASWNFIIWGLIHGSFLILEKGKFGKVINVFPKPFRHLYALLIVINAWVFFRVETLLDAFQYLQVMYGFGDALALHPYIWIKMDISFFTSLIAAIILVTPLYKFLKRNISLIEFNSLAYCMISLIRIGFFGILFLFSITHLSAGSYNPFIYFRF